MRMNDKEAMQEKEREFSESGGLSIVEKIAKINWNVRIIARLVQEEE